MLRTASLRWTHLVRRQVFGLPDSEMATVRIPLEFLDQTSVRQMMLGTAYAMRLDFFSVQLRRALDMIKAKWHTK